MLCENIYVFKLKSPHSLLYYIESHWSCEKFFVSSHTITPKFIGSIKDFLTNESFIWTWKTFQFVTLCYVWPYNWTILTSTPLRCFIFVVIGSRQWPLLRLDNYGFISADGQSYCKQPRNSNGTLIGGLGGGSGGTILLFLQSLALAENSSLSAVGGYGGSLGGGGGGGGRIHFHWSKIAGGEEYVPLAFVDGAINFR